MMANKEKTTSSVQGIMNEFEKTLKVYQMYEENHPSTNKAMGKFYERITQFLNDNGALILRIGQFELYYEDAIIYQNLERGSSLAFKLFRDGLRGIGFEKGIGREEVTEVMKILNLDFSQSDEDDIVTKLWEKNLSHVQYWEAEDDTQPPESVMTKLFGTSGLAEKAEGETVSGADINIEELVLKPEEIGHIKTEVDEIERIGISYDLVDIFEYLIKYEDDENIKSKLMDNFPGLVFNLLTRENFEALNRCLTILKNIHNYLSEIDLKTTKLIANIFSRLQTEFVILGLASQLENGNRQVEVFLSFLGKEVIEPLFKLLDLLTRNIGREIVIRILANLCKEDKSPLLKRLRGDDIKMAKTAVLILETIGDDASIGFLEEIMKHPAAELRKFLIETIDTIKSDKIYEILIEASNDAEFNIRFLALKQMAATGSDYFVLPLMKIINDKRFKQKEIEEKRAIFYTLADCGGKKTVDFFRRILKKWSLFGRKRLWELKQISAFSLARINEPEAKKVIDDGLNSRDRNMRELCTKALTLARGGE